MTDLEKGVREALTRLQELRDETRDNAQRIALQTAIRIIIEETEVE